MVAPRDLYRHFKAAEWTSAEQVQSFVVAATSQEIDGDELARLVPLLGPREPRTVRERRTRVLTEVLKRRPERAVFAPALKLLRNTTLEPDARRALGPLLAAASDPRMHDDLCQMLRGKDELLREVAALVLKESGGKTALSTLQRLLGQEGWASRKDAMDVVCEIAGHHAVDSLRGVLQVGPPPERAYAAKLLGEERYMKRGRRAAAQALELALTDAHQAVVMQGISSYAQSASLDDFLDRCSRFMEADDPRMAATAVGALAYYSGAPVVEVLQRVVRHERMNVRLAALDALERIGNDDVLGALSTALGDNQMAIRSKASEVLIRLAGSGKVELGRMLLWLFRSRDVNVRRQAVEIVRHVGGDVESMWPRLLQLLRDEDWWVRERVVDVLVEMAGSKLTRHIVAYLQDDSDVVRRYAVEVLMRIKDPRALGALVRTAQDDQDWWVRERAVEAVGELGDARALPYVLELARTEEELGFVCATTLGKLGGVEAVAALMVLLEHADPDVRMAAVDALEQCGDRNIVQELAHRPPDENKAVRERLQKLLAAWNIHADGLAAEAAAERLAGLDRMLMSMVQSGGDDLFLVSERRPYVKRMGAMVPASETVIRAEQVEALVHSLVTREQREQLDALEDIDMSYEVQREGLRFRLNIFRQATGLSCVFRAVPRKILNGADLGWPDVVHSLSELRSGLVLVSGPTGCGKSTTLAALVDLINRRDTRHILTIEDPVEVVHPQHRCLVNQREVGVHTATFSTALRAALREDPDVILVGEMRDRETIGFAVTAAETGHLVLGTLHTVSADTSIDRIVNAFPSDQQPQVRAMVAESLRAVLCQQLLKGRREGERVLAMEILLANDAVSNIIRKGKTYQLPSLVATSRELGMQSMDNDLMRLVKQGKVEPVEAWLKSNNKKEFEPLLPEGVSAIAAASQEQSPAPAPAQAMRSVASGPQPVPSASGPHAMPGASGPQPVPGASNTAYITARRKERG